MTTAFAIGVIVIAAGVGVAFLWSCFSGAAAWIERDEPAPLSEPPPRSSYAEDRQDD